MRATRQAPWMCAGCGYMMDAYSPVEVRAELLRHQIVRALVIDTDLSRRDKSV